MSKYPRITLKETPFDKQIEGEAVQAPHNLLDDIKALKAHFNDSYWAIIKEPQPNVISPAEFDEDGSVTKEAEYTDAHYAIVILPENHDFDLSELSTIDNS